MHCGNKSEMLQEAFFRKVYPDYEPMGPFGELECVAEYAKTWKLFFCPVCKNATLILEEFNDYAEPTVERNQLYPPVDTEHGEIPRNIKKAFTAAVTCRNLDGAMCAMGLRRTLEMICKDKGETEGNLFKKLQKLSNKGILPPILDQMAAVLRELGNSAAHADDINYEFPSELAPDLIEFTKVILNYLYVLPSKIQEIQSNLHIESGNNVKTE